MNNKQLIILGASGHGKVVADIAEKTGRYNSIAFLDDNIEIQKCKGFPVIGKSNSVEQYIQNSDVFIAIGNVGVRQKYLKNLIRLNASIPTLIHPNAVIGRNVNIGIGTVIMAGVVINSDTQIGNGCIINTSASIDHDCVIHDYVHVSVGVHIAGTVEIMDNTWIGAGATIIQGLVIGQNTMVGAGGVVIKDIPENCTAVGAPAKPIKFNE